MRLGGRAAICGCLALGLALVLSGCSSPDATVPESKGPTTTRVDPVRRTPTTDAASEGTDAVEQYKRFWEVRFAANQDPVNPDDPRLREVATGSQLENVVSETAKRKADGLAFRSPERSVARRSVRVVAEADGVKTVQDCSVNDGVLYRVATGEVIDDSIVTNSVEATLRLVGGVWKVESTRLLQQWQGVAGCALAS